MASLAEIRQQYPQYSDMSDQQLSDALYQKFYSDMPREQFDQQLGATAQPSAPASPLGTPNAPTINVGGRQISTQEYAAMPDAERQAIRDEVGATNTVHSNLAQGNALNPLLQGMTFGLDDEMTGLIHGAQAAMQGGDFGDQYRASTDQVRAELDSQRRQHPWQSVGLEMLGALPTGAIAGGGLASMGTSLGQRALIGGGVGAAQGAVYGAGASQEGNRGAGAALGAGVGAATGAAAPFVGNWMQNRAQAAQQGAVLNQAARNAPQSSELRSAASSLFDQADNANVMIDRPAFDRLFSNIRNATSMFRPNQSLDPKAMGALQVLQQTYDDVMRTGSNVLPDIRDLHILRQAAQKAATSSEGRDSTIANTIVRQIDDFVQNLRPGDIAGGADPSAASNSLMNAISTWSRASKVSVVEDAIERARNVASGFENGLRTEFRKLLSNKSLNKMWSQAERQAIEGVVRGAPMANLAKLVGKFGFGSGNASNMLGGTIGFGAGSMTPLGPVGGVLAAAGATGARKASEALTGRAANRALGAVATPNLTQIPPVNPAQAGVLEQLMRQLGAPAAGQSAQIVNP